jgi:endonuclease G
VSAYLLSQEGLMPTEGFRFGPFKTYQVPLAKVGMLADLKFAKPLELADVFAGQDVQESFESGRFAEIEGPDDLVLTRIEGHRKGARRKTTLREPGTSAPARHRSQR